ERGSDVWADLAAGADGTLHALDLGGPSVLTLPPGGPPDRVGVGLSARRLALRADGLRLILGRDGWVRGRDAQGRLQTAFDASRPDLDPGSRPADLAVDAAGDVLVVDRVAASVTRWTWDPAAEPPRAPEAEPSCRAEGDKRAAPAEIALGETVELTLSLDGRCEGAQASVPLDVFLLLDRSGSMGGESLRVAREAALDFIARADLASTRIGLISFNTQARVDAPLGQDAWRLRQALTSLDARGGTDIAAALAVANDAIGQSGRLSARWAFVLLSDGGSAHAPAIAEADRARRAGVEIFTIGVQADAVLLRALADDAEHYFEAARVGDLYAVFARIAERIEAEALFQTLEVVDELPADMALVAGSIDPPPEAIEPGPPVTLRWRLAGVPAEGVVLRYRLQPQQAGLRPTNRIAWADYVDGFGRIGRVDLPLPEVRVIGPTATPSPSPRPSPRASATAPARPTLPAGPSAEPRALYLPLLLQERCIPGARHADVLLVMDASGSMAGAKLVAARAAALQLIDLLSLPADQVGLVAFNAQAMRLAPLGSPRSAVAQALAGLDTSPGTRIDRGLSAALAELLGPRARATNTPTLVLLTDGQQAEAPETARARAAEARAFGVQLFAIGLGAELDLDSLAGLAGGRQRAFLAPGPEDLAAIYRAVAGRIPCPAEAFWGRR
ncbi:MAG: VWA domain-containing protein, partial [Chloroflexi bacterium]|nr:VWA domain-containing protein [Chloroflexota bacterium]